MSSQSPSILGIIPARFGSTRFPAKALVDIKGKTMVRRVYERAKLASSLSEVIVATDHPLIYEEVKSFGGQVVMTSENHISGTDRCEEACTLWGKEVDFVINIQGDEPFIEPEQINLLAKILQSDVELATLVFPTSKHEDIFSANAAKVVLNQKNEAIYFSRSPIPYVRKDPDHPELYYGFFRHIGIYAYRRDILKAITQLAPTPLEIAESLEQLRWIEHGYKIKVAQTPYESHGVDTPEDLVHLLQIHAHEV